MPAPQSPRQKLLRSVREAADRSTPELLARLGYTRRDVEAAVRAGDLRWLADGRVEVRS